MLHLHVAQEAIQLVIGIAGHVEDERATRSRLKQPGLGLRPKHSAGRGAQRNLSATGASLEVAAAPKLSCVRSVVSRMRRS